MTITLTKPTVLDAASAERAAPSLLGDVSGELVMRMTNGPQAGRIVRLSAAKCSIGSSPDCTLRLRGAGIEPVHCMIVRGARQTVVRRWSHDTRVNDRHFDDVGLRDGDRLAVGPIEFQVVKVPGPAGEPARTARRVETELAAATARIERLTERLDLANRQGRRRLRSVLARLRKYQLRLNDVDGRRSQLALEQERLQSEAARLARQNADLQAHKNELQRARDDWDRQNRDASQTAAAAIAEATTRFERAEQALRNREADLVGRAAALEDRLAKLAAGEQKLAARESELTRQADELRRLADTMSQREAELASRTNQLTTRESELLKRSNELQGRASELQGRTAELQNRANELRDRETAAGASADALRRTEADVAARCEALKNHWAELIERERSLELALEHLAVREREIAAAQKPLLAAPPAEPIVAQIETAAPTAVAQVDDAALRQFEEDRRALETERERYSVASAEVRRRRDELNARQVKLAARRSTLELAARVLDRRAALTEADEAAFAERLQAWETAQAAKPAESNEPAEPVVAETSLADRLTIERLEALVKTWRNEAELWKSRFDEVEFGDQAKKSAEPQPDHGAEPTPEEIRSPQPETDVQTVPPVVDVAAADEAVENDAVEELSNPTDDEVEPTETVAATESNENSESDDTTAAEPEAAAPVKEVKSESAADVLRRMGLTAVLEENGPAAVEPPPPPRPVPPPKAPEHHEGDESLDDYMQLLFQRLGVKNQTPEAPPASSSTRSVAKQEVAVEESEPAAPVAPVIPLTASEFKARSVAAERKSDLSALRELANVSAKTAIAKHQVKTQSSKSKWKLITAAGSLGLAGVSALSYFVLGHDWAKYGAIGGLAVTVLSVFQSAGFKRGATKTARTLDDVLQKSSGRAPTNDATAESNRQ